MAEVRQRWLRRALVALALCSFALVVLWPEWHDRYPITHEAAYGDRYAVLVGHFQRALEAGVTYPRWLPELKGGYGYPTFCFYQPAFFFVGGRLAQVPGLGLSKATSLAVFFFLLLGASGAYVAARQRAGRWFSVFGAAVFLFTPWVCTNLYVRGDLSELSSVMVLPWVTAFLWRTLERFKASRAVGTSVAGLALSLALVVYAHPTTALSTFALMPLLFVASVLELPERRWRALGVLFAGYVAALALAAPYWVPVFQLRPLVHLELAVTDYYLAHRHLLVPSEFFARTFEFGGSIPDSPDDHMPFQLGLPHFLLAVGGVVAARKQRQTWLVLSEYVALLFLMTTGALAIWENVKPLAIFQFPWRLLSPVTWLQWWLVVGYASLGAARWGVKALLGVVALGVTLAVGAPQFQTNPALPMTFAEMDVRLFQESFDLLLVSKQYANQDEFLPRTAGVPAEGPRRDRPLIEAPVAKAVTELPGHSAYRMHVRVKVPEATWLKVNQFYFPGWRVRVNGVDVERSVLESTLLPDGRMQVSVQGEVDVEAWYDGPPGGTTRLVVMLLVLATCALVVRRVQNVAS